ncbi:MAG: hypothetical protein ACE5LU_01190 [Anaerolineae bacterium]
MKGTDRFLIGIVAGVVLLVGVAFAVAFLRPEPSYRPEDTPEGVAHNYLFALQQEDYARAYGYLSPTLKGYPASVEIFTEDIHDHRWSFRTDRDSVTLEVESARITGNRVLVSVRETRFYGRRLFDSSQYTNTFDMKLQRENGAWKIIASDSYWLECWDELRGCS